MAKRPRLIIGKMGLDAHDNGLRIVAKWLMDSGYEVIYAGLYNTPERMVQMALEENADGIGISFLGGEHVYYANALVSCLQQRQMRHVKIIIDGVIPPHDVASLKHLGIDAVFTPGTRKQEIVDRIAALFA